MSLTQDKILVSVELILDSNAINVLWSKRVLDDGVVISAENHRGAYPLLANGDVDIDMQSDLGKSLADIFGDAANHALAENVTLRAMIASLEHERSMLNAELNLAMEKIALLQAAASGDSSE